MRHAFRAMLAFILFAVFTPHAYGQVEAYKSNTSDHVNIGIFGDFFRVSQNEVNLAGLGARASFKVYPLVQIEAEANYDFDQVFTEVNTTGATIQRTAFRDVTGLVGPKLMTNHGPVRLFVTAKGGVVSFHLGNGPATFGGFASTVENLRLQNLNGVFYPGGGAEAFWGPIGLRFDVGDEMYFNNGVHNNLRATFGPTIRF